jgi:riboflavin synthase
MFSGIVEEMGTLKSQVKEAGNLRLTVACSFVSELRVDQSISHNGVCLTVDALKDGAYEVVCIGETLSRTNLSRLQPGERLNLERSLRAGDRIDGHIVQGHVDETGTVKEIIESGGSWLFRIAYSPSSENTTVEKGSVCMNGVSLTVVDSGDTGVFRGHHTLYF